MAFGGVLKADMRRMLRGRNIYVTLAGTMLITLVGMVPESWAYRAEGSVFYLAYQHTLSNQFFLLMTMLAVFPFGLSYREDEKHHYDYCIYSRTGVMGYCWSHMITAVAGTFLAVLTGYLLSYGVLGFFFPLLREAERHALELSDKDVYTCVILSKMPVFYFVCTAATEAAGHAFLAGTVLFLSVYIKNSFLLLSIPAIFYYGSNVLGNVLELPGIFNWYYVLENGGWLAGKISDIRLLMPCIVLYLGSLIWLEGVLFVRAVERRRTNG